MYKQTIPLAAFQFARMLQREQEVLNRRVRLIFNRVEYSFAEVADEVELAVSSSQQKIAAGAQTYAGRILGPVDAGVGKLNTVPLIGVTGIGIPIEEVFAGSRIMTTQEALRTGLVWGFQLTKAALADTARQSTILGMSGRQTAGYVRALVGNTCSRCAILAGKHYVSDEAFLRHPNCDCIHVPYRSDQAPSPTVNANEYFDSLTEQEQDRAFTKAGAEAIREGADINQVVNARRGMSSVANAAGQRRLATRRLYGQDLAVTSEGMTRRGFAYNRLRNSPNGSNPAKAPRLMPESISKLAGGDKEKLRMLLRRNGYIL